MEDDERRTVSTGAHDDPTEDMHPLNTEARIAVMSVQIAHIGQTLNRIEQGATHSVPRAEWEQRNTYVDLRFVDAFTKIASIQNEAASRRAPWWAVIGAGAGAIAVVAYLFDIIPTIVN